MHVVGVLVAEIVAESGIPFFLESIDVLTITFNLATPLRADPVYVPTGGERFAPGILVVGSSGVDVLRDEVGELHGRIVEVIFHVPGHTADPGYHVQQVFGG